MNLKENFPIENPGSVSTRIFFAKDSESSILWHLCDAALGQAHFGKVWYMALHGAFLYPVVQCDTVLQCKIRLGVADQFCRNCLDEYELAKDVIERKKLLKFR